ncbi:MAG: CocE/NonD family hydrolase, partial [Streptosporangiaceae bacterium]
FWAPLQCGAALERISVPTLLIGGWQDLFLEQTIEQFGVLAERDVPTRMLIGPWTHLDTATRAGAAFTEGLAWLERHAGQAPGEPATGHSVRFWVGGAREWREAATWPPAGQTPQRWYLGPDGTLTSKAPTDGPPATFRYDPADPTPSVGGAILSLSAGVRDNRAVEQRRDVLVFSSEPLDEPVEVVGDVIAELHVTRDNPNADLFVRLCDVDPPGDAKSRSRNVCDGIVRLTDADPLTGTVRVSLIAAAHRFGRGHRLWLQVTGGAHPRFARNPGNGQVDASAKDFVVTHYSIQSPSALVISQAAGKEAAHV